MGKLSSLCELVLTGYVSCPCGFLHEKVHSQFLSFVLLLWKPRPRGSHDMFVLPEGMRKATVSPGASVTCLAGQEFVPDTSHRARLRTEPWLLECRDGGGRDEGK